MSIFMHGTIRNQVQMKALNVKWELSKNKIHIGKDEKKPLSERERLIQRFHEECENNKKSEIYNKIYSKIKSGKKLSSEEIAYIKDNNPDMLKEYRQIQAEKAAYEKELKNCKTKEDVERVKLNKVGEYMSSLKSIESNPNIPKGKKLQLLMELNAKVTMMAHVHNEFKASAEYNSMPEEAEIRKEELQEELQRQEEIRENISQGIEESEKAKEVFEDDNSELENMKHDAAEDMNSEHVAIITQSTELDETSIIDETAGKSIIKTDDVYNGKNNTAADEKGEKIHKPKKKKPVSFTDVSSELSLIISKISIVPSDIQSQSGYTKSV